MNSPEYIALTSAFYGGGQPVLFSSKTVLRVAPSTGGAAFESRLKNVYKANTAIRRIVRLRAFVL